MKFMNEWELEDALTRYQPEVTPRRAAVARIVYSLKDWTNSNSDGWAYWPKPVRACAKAFELLDPSYADRRTFESEDCTEAEMTAALRPIKTFLTREKVEDIDLPKGYRWATADETEAHCAGKLERRAVVIARSFDSSGKPYLQQEADLAVRA